MENKRIVLNEEDKNDLKKLYEDAQRTPVIYVGNTTSSLADDAWDLVRKKFDELGRKYGFNPKQIKGISPADGTVFL